jgi:hypothetical protein
MEPLGSERHRWADLRGETSGKKIYQAVRHGPGPKGEAAGAAESIRPRSARLNFERGALKLDWFNQSSHGSD